MALNLELFEAKIDRAGEHHLWTGAVDRSGTGQFKATAPSPPPTNASSSTPSTYISRNNRFYVVADDGVDPATGRERRRWHSAGTSRADAQAIASSITETTRVPIPHGRDAVALGERYITPAVGQYPLRSIRTEHLNDFCTALTATGGQHGTGLAARTVHKVHLIGRSALTQTTEQGLTRTNVALRTHRPRPHARPRGGNMDRHRLTKFLRTAAGHRLYPARCALLGAV